MKLRLTAVIAGMLTLPLYGWLHTPEADAHCRVQCQPVQAVVAVPVVAAEPYIYSYQAPQPVNVTVNVNADEIADKIVAKLTAVPPVSAEPPPPHKTTVEEMQKRYDTYGPGGPKSLDAAPPPIPNGTPIWGKDGVRQEFNYDKNGPTGTPVPPPPVSVTAMQSCTRCHSPGNSAKALAKYDFSDLSKLPCEAKLAAIRAVVTESMPPKEKLTADQAGKVIEELVGK